MLNIANQKAVRQDRYIVIPFTPPSNYPAPPLKWKLSPKQRAAYGIAWEKLTKKVADQKKSQLDESTSEKSSVDGSDSKTKDELKDTVENLLSDSSYKAEEAIAFLEEKLAELKKQNTKLQK